MENIPLEPNEELLKILGDIDFVNVEETRSRRGKRSSILKRPKNSEDDIQTEDLQAGAKSMGARRRVSFAEKFQVMEMNTGNIYDISAKTNSPSIKNSTQNEDIHTESNLDDPLQDCYTSVVETSSKNTSIASSIKINKRENEDTSVSLVTKKHAIDSDCDLQPERKKMSTEYIPHNLKSESVFTYSSDISEYKNYLFNTTKDFTFSGKRILDTESICNQNPCQNGDSLQSQIPERYIGNESKLTTNKYNLSKYDEIIQRMNMSLQSDNVQWGLKDRSNIKDALGEFESVEPTFTIFKDKDTNITDKIPNVELYDISLSNVPLAENKENMYVDMKSKSILCTNARQLMLKDEIISEDVKNPIIKSHISNEISKMTLSKVNLQDSERGIAQISSKDRSDTDKTCMFSHPMDLTCVSEMDVSNNCENSENIVCEDIKFNKERMFDIDNQDKTVLDSSQYMDMTCNPQNLTVMQDSLDSSIKDVLSSEPAKQPNFQDEDVIHNSSFCYQSKDDKTVLNTSDMDLTCYPQNLTVMQDTFDDSAKDVSILGPTEQKLQQRGDTFPKNCFGNQHEDKVLSDTSDHMDFTCNLKSGIIMQNSSNDRGQNVSVSEPPLLLSEQNENVTLKSFYRNEFKNNKTVFGSSDYMDLTSNLKATPKVSESSLRNVSEISQQTTQQKDNITDKCKTVFDTCYMDLTCNLQDLSSIKSNSPENSVKGVSILKSLKQAAYQSNEMTINNDENQLDSFQIDLTYLPCSRIATVELLSDMKNVSASESSRHMTQEYDEYAFSTKQKKDLKDIGKIDKNQTVVSDVLYDSKTQIPCLEKKFSEDDGCSLKSTCIPPGEHLLYSNYSDKETIIPHSNTCTPNQLQNKKNLSVLKNLIGDEEVGKKIDFSNSRVVIGNVKDLRDNLSESHKKRLNPAWCSDFTQTSKENNFHEPFTVKQRENMRAQNCALEISNSGMYAKKNLEDTERTPVSSSILKSETDGEILNTSLPEAQNIQKLKDFVVITEDVPGTSEKHKSDVDKIFHNNISSNSFVSSENNIERVIPNLLKKGIKEVTNSIPSVQNQQKLGDYMFVKTDVKKGQVCEKVDAYKGEILDSYNPNLILSTERSDNELEKETDKVFTSKENLFKYQADADNNSTHLLVENSKKQEKDIVVKDSIKKTPLNSKVENKADNKFNSDKMNPSLPVEITNNILINEAKEDVSNDIKSEQDKCKCPTDHDILYAIKQIKGMNQFELNEQNILKFPEVFLSVKKKPVPPKRQFSCSSVQFSKAVRECVRRSSNYTGEELSFTSDFKREILSKDKCVVMKDDQNLPKDPDNNCSSEHLTHCNIPSASQVVRSATKIVQKKSFISYALSPRQIQETEKTNIPQLFKKSFNLSETDDLDPLRKSLNFDNEVTCNLPKSVVSSSAKQNVFDFTKNTSVVTDNSELFLENCSIDLVPNDDLYDSNVSKHNFKLDLSKISNHNEVLSQRLSSRKSIENKEVFVHILQDEDERDNIDRSSVFLNNSDVGLKSGSVHEVQESGRNVFFGSSLLKQNNSSQNSFNILRKQSFDSKMHVDKNNKANTKKETLDIEMQNISKPLDVSKFKTNRESSESVYLVNESQSNINAKPQEAPKDKLKEGHNSSGLMYSQCLPESVQVFEVTKEMNSLLRKELESHIIPDLSSSTLKRKSNNEDISFLKESNLQELRQNYAATSMEVDENSVLPANNETNVGKLNLDKSKLSNQVDDLHHDFFLGKENNCTVKQKLITEVTIIEKRTVVDKVEKDEYTATPMKLLKVKQNVENCEVFVTETQNPHLPQENLVKNIQLSVSNLNEQSVDNIERLKNNGSDSYMHVSFVQRPFELLENEAVNDVHQSTGKMSSAYSNEENQIIKEVTNETLNKNLESSCAAAITNTSVLSKPIIIDQCEQNILTKQDSSANMEVIVNDGSNNQGTNDKSQNCLSNLSIADGKSLMLVNEGNLGGTKDSESEDTKHYTNPASTKKVGQKRKKKGSSSSLHDTESQLEKKYTSVDCTEIQAMNKKYCSPILETTEIPNKSFEDEFEKFHTLRKRLIEASEKEDCLWSLRKMDDKQAVFEILPISAFACYLIYVPLEHNSETSSSAKISFKHLKPEPDGKDEMGFLLFKSYATSQITFSPFSTEELIEALSKYVDYALLAKSFIKDLWFVAIRNTVTFDCSQEIPKLIVKVLNRNHFSLFELTFDIDLKSYPREKLFPKINHLNDDNILSTETILNALREIEPGKNYLSNMMKAVNAL